MERESAKFPYICYRLCLKTNPRGDGYILAIGESVGGISLAFLWFFLHFWGVFIQWLKVTLYQWHLTAWIFQVTYLVTMFLAFSLQKEKKGEYFISYSQTFHRYHFVKYPALERFQTLDLWCHMVHFVSMPSVSMELTRLTSINTSQDQSLSSVSTTQGYFINSDVSSCAVSVENGVNNAGNRIVCHSKSDAVNSISNAHSHSDNSLTGTHYNSLSLEIIDGDIVLHFWNSL